MGCSSSQEEELFSIDIGNKATLLAAVESSIKWSNLTVKVGSNILLDNCNGYVPSRKVCGIMGPNGAGKTALLNILSGHFTSSQPASVTGDILVSGKKMDRKLRIGTEDYLADSNLTIRQATN